MQVSHSTPPHSSTAPSLPNPFLAFSSGARILRSFSTSFLAFLAALSSRALPSASWVGSPASSNRE